MTAFEVRNQLVLRYSTQREIVDAFIKFVGRDIQEVNRAYAEHMAGRSWRTEMRSALAHGVLHSWVNRFVAEHKVRLSPDLYFDYDRLARLYPAFADFVPTLELSEREVFQAARTELYSTTLRYVRSDRKLGSRTELVAAFQIVAPPEAFKPGESVLRIAAHLLPTFGVTAVLYWLYARYVYNNSYTTVAKVLGQARTARDVERIRKYLLRHLPKIDQFLPELRSDPVLQEHWMA